MLIRHPTISGAGFFIDANPFKRLVKILILGRDKMHVSGNNLFKYKTTPVDDSANFPEQSVLLVALFGH
jgi:hypothetical protein